jgi:hypothetical protein
MEFSFVVEVNESGGAILHRRADYTEEDNARVKIAGYLLLRLCWRCVNIGITAARC